MGKETAIAWTDHTFNIAWGCAKVSPGCAHCYADTFSRKVGFDIWGPGKARRTFGPAHWQDPLTWDQRAAAGEPGLLGPGRPHMVFSSSMCDLWEDHPTIAAEREKLWDLIERTPNLIWQILTKRPQRIAGTIPSHWSHLSHRIWLGTSIEDEAYARRADYIQGIPAAVHFVSYEPALGPLDGLDLRGLDWLIFGGESGPGFRAPAGWQSWARNIRTRCASEGVAFFFKQSPAHRTELGTTLDGETIREFPEIAKTMMARPFPK